MMIKTFFQKKYVVFALKKMRYGLKHDNKTVVKYLGEKEKALSVSTKWKPHHRNECPVCLMHQNQKKAGAPKKKRRGNPNLTGKIEL